ncbi:MAG: hypothetical protein ABUS48_05400 [Pseudomonadota bacterium]
MIRFVVALVVGMAVAIAVVWAGAIITQHTWHAPSASELHHYGVVAIWPLTITWSLAAFVGAYVASRIARGPNIGRLIAIVAALGAASNIAFIPIPFWMWSAPIIVAICGWLGASLGRRRAI